MTKLRNILITILALIMISSGWIVAGYIHFTSDHIIKVSELDDGVYKKFGHNPAFSVVVLEKENDHFLINTPTEIECSGCSDKEFKTLKKYGAMCYCISTKKQVVKTVSRQDSPVPTLNTCYQGTKFF